MIKNLLKYLLLIVLPEISYCQATDVVIESFTHYEMINGKPTGNKRVSEENFYTLNNQLIRQIVFNDSLPQIDKFIFLYYSNNNLISKETHNKKDSVEEVIRYKYSVKNNLTEENIYRRQASVLAPFETIRYKYSDSLVTEKTLFDNKMKMLEKTSYTRNKDFDTETSIFKKASKPNELKNKSVSTYYNKGKKEKSLISSEYINGIKESQTLVYNYDKKDGFDLERITCLNAENDTVQIKELRYKDGKRISEVLFDKSGNNLDYIFIERIPRTMNFGKKEMYRF